MPQSENFDNQSAVVLNDQGQVVSVRKAGVNYQCVEPGNPSATGPGHNSVTTDPPGFARRVLPKLT